jgi:hypothetical protein
MKRLFLFLAVAFCLCAANKTMAQSGTRGSCTWALSGISPNYTLTISGTGAMGIYSNNNSSRAPWYSYRRNIKILVIQHGVTSIGDYAFYYCDHLTGSIIIPNSVTSIGDYAFFSCSGFTGSLTIPNSVTSIGNSAFSGCSGFTGSLTIPNSVTSIGGSVFFSCSGLTGSLTIPNSVTSIGDYAFYYFRGLTGSLTIPNTVTSIGERAFYRCLGLTSVTIPNSVTSIGERAFYQCSGLTGSLTIPNSVTSIGDWAFYQCIGLTSVTIGNSVTTMGTSTFSECIGLTEIYVKAINPPVINSSSYSFFAAVSTSTPLHVPCGRTTVYQNDWGYFAIIIDDILFGINVQSNNTVMGTANITQAHTCTNDTAIIEATSKTGYRFLKWHDGNIANPRIVTVTRDTSFTAIFEIMHTVTVSANNPIYGNVSGNGTYPKDSLAVISATANSGYRFVQWHDGNSQNPRILIVTQDTSFIATFAVVKHHVSVTANNPSMGNVSGSGDYTANSTVTITATPNTAYRFVEWTDGNTQNPRTITLTQDTAFMAIFATSSQITYHVTVTANNPSMGSITGSGDYTANTTVTMTATPKTGYRFVQWNDGNTNNPRTITLTKDTTFTAIFAISSQITYHVSVTANNTGMGSVTGSGDYAANTTVTMMATPKTGYRFVQWNDGNNQNPRTITVTKDTSFTATFVDVNQNTYRITLLSNDQTKGTVMGGGDFPANTTTSIGAIANPGYRFVQWNDGNTDNPRTITVTQDTTFVATFDIANAIEEIETSPISVYPNPATDNITIILPDNIYQAVFMLYDMQGKVLIRKEIGNQDAVSVSNLAAGIYIYNVTIENQNHTGKIVIND